MRQVSRISARIFHSSDAAENDHWLDIASDHVHYTIVWTDNLKKWPAVLRPWVYPFVQGRGLMTQRFGQGQAVVAQTLSKRKAQMGGHLSSPPSLLDHLADSDLGGDDVEAHTVAQINLCVAAIQSMASTVTQCLMDLATHPQYLPELRDEITSILIRRNGALDRQGLTEMMKLDSFIKETQRLNPPDLGKYSVPPTKLFQKNGRITYQPDYVQPAFSARSCRTSPCLTAFGYPRAHVSPFPQEQSTWTGSSSTTPKPLTASDTTGCGWKARMLAIATRW